MEREKKFDRESSHHSPCLRCRRTIIISQMHAISIFETRVSPPPSSPPIIKTLTLPRKEKKKKKKRTVFCRADRRSMTRAIISRGKRFFPRHEIQILLKHSYFAFEVSDYEVHFVSPGPCPGGLNLPRLHQCDLERRRHEGKEKRETM